MNYYDVLNHDTHNVNYIGKCPSNIQQKILVWGLDTPQYRTIRALAYDIFRNIMIEFKKLLNPHPECVCLAIWDVPSPAEHQTSKKRKQDDVEY